MSLNTAAVKNPKLVYEGAKRYGSQCIVAAVDAKLRPEWPDGRSISAAEGRPQESTF